MIAPSFSPLGLTVLGSGSKGNAILVHAGKDALLVDAGLSLRDFRRRCEASGLPHDLDIHGILITHEHSDHTKGLAKIAETLRIPAFATSRCAWKIKNSGLTIPFTQFEAGNEFPVGPFTVRSFSVPHDATDTVGYTITAADVKIGIALDFGIGTSPILTQLKGCAALVIESNHDPRLLSKSQRPERLKQRIGSNFGHLSNHGACEMIEKVAPYGLRHVILAHLSEECNTPELAVQTAQACLNQLGRPDITLAVAEQRTPLPTLWIQETSAECK